MNSYIGSKALADALPNWPNLKSLNLGDCLLSGPGGILVIKALIPGNTKLERIALFFNEINEKGAKFVPDMLQNKTELKSIELNGNNFEGDGSVAQAIRDTLRSLNKEDCLDELDEMELESDEEEEEEDENIEEKPSVSVDDLANQFGQVNLQK